MRLDRDRLLPGPSGLERATVILPESGVDRVFLAHWLRQESPVPDVYPCDYIGEGWFGHDGWRVCAAVSSQGLRAYIAGRL